MVLLKIDQAVVYSDTLDLIKSYCTQGHLRVSVWWKWSWEEHAARTLDERSSATGSIEWDGAAIFNATETRFRRNVAVMFQKTMLSKGTIRENIAFGLPEN